mmetsp:Transcript_26699/g.70115  ORF Transcript_26699/g.70115 Transcript_26699/m.70115 type:complete len:460 (-) Transcript_26699:483-1862(-)
MSLDFGSPSTPKTPKTPQGDRFIPKRSAFDGDMARYSLSGENNDPQSPSSAKRTPARDLYRTTLASSMLGKGTVRSKILDLQQTDSPRPAADSHMPLSPTCPDDRSPRRATRYIPMAPDKILDAPELMDDYYLNLLDWSSSNVLAVALGTTVYLWNAATGAIEQLCETTREGDHITSVSWSPDGSRLAVGTHHAEVQLWDPTALRQIRSLGGHQMRVGSLAWNSGGLLSSGSRDSTIANHDSRAAQNLVSQLHGAHTQEICGLRWSPSGSQLASGGNDNLLCIWDLASALGSQGASQAPRHRITHHQAAVKALAWSPHQAQLLASGGGTADRRICFWNTSSGAMQQEVNTGSQVCALLWSTREKEILSSHGFTQNQLTLWKYPTMTKVADLTGHQSRVLHMAPSPDGCTVVSGAADETLRFWRVFGSDGHGFSSGGSGSGKSGRAAFSSPVLARASSIR